jgi:hypothetical protein
MNKSRITYFIAICTVLVLGFASRQFSIIPLFIGDVLWALMIFLIFRFLFINNIRDSTLGGLILGQGFLWSDIVAYTTGIIIGASFESILRPKS